MNKSTPNASANGSTNGPASSSNTTTKKKPSATSSNPAGSSASTTQTNGDSTHSRLLSSNAGSPTGNGNGTAAPLGNSATAYMNGQTQFSLSLMIERMQSSPFAEAVLVQILGPMIYEGLSISEVAAELGINPSYVKWCLNEMRRELQ